MEHKITYVNIKEVKGADVNPKQHDIGTLHQSMDRFGFIAPIIRNEATGKLVGGHGRIETLRQKHQLDKTSPPKGIKMDELEQWFVPVITGIEFDSDDEADAVKTGSLDGIGYDAEDLQNLLEDVERLEEEIETDTETDPLKVSIKFDNEGQRDDWARFLKWLRNSSDLGSDGARLAEFIRNVI